MTNFIGKAAPAFTATAVMADGTTQDVSLSDYSGKYVALFFYPKDFTVV
jgi:alkyl hydroperoxide reductase subunit AhpC